MKLRNKKTAFLAMSLVAFVTSQDTARADDIAAEIRLLKARVKQLEPLKQQLKQLEEKLAKQDRKQRETEARVRTTPPPGTVCKDAPCPPPVFVSFGKNFNNGPLVEFVGPRFQLQNRWPAVTRWRGFQSTREGLRQPSKF